MQHLNPPELCILFFLKHYLVIVFFILSFTYVPQLILLVFSLPIIVKVEIISTSGSNPSPLTKINSRQNQKHTSYYVALTCRSFVKRMYNAVAWSLPNGRSATAGPMGKHDLLIAIKQHLRSIIYRQVDTKSEW